MDLNFPLTSGTSLIDILHIGQKRGVVSETTIYPQDLHSKNFFISEKTFHFILKGFRRV